MSSPSGRDSEAAKPRGFAMGKRAAWSKLARRQPTPLMQMRPKPQGSLNAPKSSRFEAEYDFGLMKTTSILRSAVETGDEKLAKERIADLTTKKSLGFTIQDVAGNGLLQIAALKNYVGMTKLLLDKHFARIDGVDSNHGTALQAAIYMNHHDIIELLLDPERPAKANVNTQGGYYGCALQVAAFKGSADLIKRLLAEGADVSICGGKYGSVLQAAARTGLPSIMQLILDANPQPNNVNMEGGVYGTALQAAAKGEYTGSTTYLRHLSRGRVLRQATSVPRATETSIVDYLRVAEILIKWGATVNICGGRLESPINAAASSGKLDMLQLLVENDKSSHEERRREYSHALISAITQTFVQDRLPLVKLLIDNGAGVSLQIGSGLCNTPLTAAAAMNSVDVVEYLLQVAKDKKALINAESGIYGSALRAALSAQAKETASCLTCLDADISSAKDHLYGNVLHLATFSNMNDVVELLLERGVDVNLMDEAGQTALHVAAYRGFEQIVCTLLKWRAQTDLKDAWGDTALKIVEDVIERESHPGPSLDDLWKVKQQLLKPSLQERKQNPGDPFHGPPIIKKPQAGQLEQGTAKPVFASPIWNPGLSFKATIIDFLEKGGDEYLLIKTLSIDDLLYRKQAMDQIMSRKEGYKHNCRWIHLPANNMTWAEMLLKILWNQKHANTSCKSFWGTDPYFVSPDLAPHARFVTPQCERLIPDTFDESSPPPDPTSGPYNTLFLAMPYIHWESYRSVEAVSDILDEIKEDALKTRILRAGRTWRTTECLAPPRIREPKPPSRATNDKIQDDDDELLRKYLFKRWPIHLRRTLDQYYYSYLADTRTRDGDQVVMRARNEELQQTKSAINGKHLGSAAKQQSSKSQQRQTSNHTRRTYNAPKTDEEVHPVEDSENEFHNDGNSPLVMIDQLWLWVLDTDTIITSFPRRRSDKEDGDLDTENKTDVLQTLLAYLHSAKRHPIQDAYDLSEVIISQCVGILHRSDVIPDLDFLKIFGSRANWAVDEVMERLTEFVHNFEHFMDWLNQKHRDSEEYIERFEKIFTVTDETLLLREIQDIKDELNMLAAVASDQYAVLKEAGRNIAEDRKKMTKTRSSAFNFEQQSQKHSRHIERMRVQASQAYDTLRDLVHLKQQQANVLEARVSRNQAIASKEQGKTIMVFTIVTIIFLPLTFMTTVFSLPVLEFQRTDPTDGSPGMLKALYVFLVIVGVTMILAIPLIIAAFKVKRLQKSWEGWKEWRNRKIPLHFRRGGVLENPDDDDHEEPTAWTCWRLYWGGPNPVARRKTTFSSDV